jgi:hypothetical protein
VITRTVTLNSGVPCTLSATLETYDTSSGVTHLYLSNVSTPNIPNGGNGLGR